MWNNELCVLCGEAIGPDEESGVYYRRLWLDRSLRTFCLCSECHYLPTVSEKLTKRYEQLNAPDVTVEPHEHLPTGSVRDSRVGKGRYDCMSPIALHRLAMLHEYGMEHYPKWNWLKGMPYMRCLDSVYRHLNNWVMGIRDPDHGDNLAAAAWNIHCLMTYEELIEQGVLPAELDDRPASLRGKQPSLEPHCHAQDRTTTASPPAEPDRLPDVANSDAPSTPSSEPPSICPGGDGGC